MYVWHWSSFVCVWHSHTWGWYVRGQNGTIPSVTHLWGQKGTILGVSLMAQNHVSLFSATLSLTSQTVFFSPSLEGFLLFSRGHGLWTSPLTEGGQGAGGCQEEEDGWPGPPSGCWADASTPLPPSDGKRPRFVAPALRTTDRGHCETSSCPRWVWHTRCCCCCWCFGWWRHHPHRRRRQCPRRHHHRHRRTAAGRTGGASWRRPVDASWRRRWGRPDCLPPWRWPSCCGCDRRRPPAGRGP